jgi:hypothetical protein
MNSSARILPYDPPERLMTTIEERASFLEGRAAEDAVIRQHMLRTLESMDGKINAQFHWLVGLFVTTVLGFAAILVTLVGR